MRSADQLLDVGEHCDSTIAQSCRFPVRRNRVSEFVVPEQVPQTADVVRDSVVAVIDCAHNNGDDLPFDTSQCLGSCHCGRVEDAVTMHSDRVEGVNLHDVVNSTMASVNNVVVLFTEIAYPLVLALRLNPRHRSRSRLGDFERDGARGCTLEQTPNDAAVNLAHNGGQARSRAAEGTKLCNDPVFDRIG